jgi:hypothetical protein
VNPAENPWTDYTAAMIFRSIRRRGALTVYGLAIVLVSSAVGASTASAAPKNPKPSNSACSLIPARDVRALFHTTGSLKLKTTSFADAPSSVGGVKFGWNYNCTVAAIPNPNQSEETEAVTWFPGASRSVYSAVSGPAYGLNTGHAPIRSLPGVGQAAVDFGNNVVVFTKGNVVALTVTPSGAIGAQAAALPVATLKKAATDAIHHLS